MGTSFHAGDIQFFCDGITYLIMKQVNRYRSPVEFFIHCDLEQHRACEWQVFGDFIIHFKRLKQDFSSRYLLAP